MPEKDRLTPTELLSRRRNFTRMSKSNLGKRLRVKDPSVQNPIVSSIQFKQLGGFGSGFTTRSNDQSTPTFKVQPNTAPPNQFIPNPNFKPNFTPKQISPQTTRRIQQIFRGKPARPVLRQRSRRSPLKEVIEEEKPVRELTPKKKPWKAKWVIPKDWKKKDGRD